MGYKRSKSQVWFLDFVNNLQFGCFEFRGSRWSLPLDIDFDLFYTFDLKPFAPKSVKNGKGRLKGYKLTKRTNKKVVKKADFDNKTRQNE